MFVASTANTTEMINAPDGFRRVDNRRDQPVQASATMTSQIVFSMLSMPPQVTSTSIAG